VSDLATAVLSDPTTSPSLRSDAQAFLTELHLDTYARYSEDETVEP
jgi:hypothetical protein